MCAICWLTNDHFFGFAVLDPIYGNNTNTNLVIGIVSIVVNAITIPLGLTLINKGQDKLKQRVAVKKSNGSTQVEIKLGQKGTTKKTIKKVSVPDNVPVSDEEAKETSCRSSTFSCYLYFNWN